MPAEDLHKYHTFFYLLGKMSQNLLKGAHRLSGRVLYSRPGEGGGVQVRASPVSLCCVLEQDTLILA